MFSKEGGFSESKTPQPSSWSGDHWEDHDDEAEEHQEDDQEEQEDQEEDDHLTQMQLLETGRAPAASA